MTMIGDVPGPILGTCGQPFLQNADDRTAYESTLSRLLGEAQRRPLRPAGEQRQQRTSEAKLPPTVPADWWWSSHRCWGVPRRLRHCTVSRQRPLPPPPPRRMFVDRGRSGPVAQRLGRHVGVALRQSQVAVPHRELGCSGSFAYWRTCVCVYLCERARGYEGSRFRVVQDPSWRVGMRPEARIACAARRGAERTCERTCSKTKQRGV
jgi:hypothetical protein